MTGDSVGTQRGLGFGARNAAEAVGQLPFLSALKRHSKK